MPKSKRQWVVSEPELANIDKREVLAVLTWDSEVMPCKYRRVERWSRVG